MGTAALAYAEQGWAVFPLQPRGKMPLIAKDQGGNGFHDATRDPIQITHWWTATPQANIGGVPSSVGLVALDVDTPANWEAAERLGLLAEPTHRVTSGNTEANACHLYFRHDDPDVTSIAGMIARAGRGYVVLPPSIHPSGRPYTSDTTIHDALPLPPLAVVALRDAASTPARRENTRAIVMADRVTAGNRHAALLTFAGTLAQKRMDEDQALSIVGMFNLAKCDPPKSDDEVRRIVQYVYDRDRVNHPARHVPSVSIDHLEPRPHIAPTATTFDDTLATDAPGVLGTIVRWSLATAPCPVPLYSLAAALAIGSVAAGRRYAMTGTYSPLFLLVAGRTASGKDWVKSSVTQVLAAAAPHLLGPGDFSSEGAVLSALRDQPQLVAILDEFGQQLQASKGPGNHHRQGAMRMLMEAWSSAGGTLLGKAMSSLAMKPGEAPPRIQIVRPCLVAVGLTTPERLHTALESAHVGDGFLNRWLLLEHDAPRIVPSPRGVPPVPDAIVDWVRTLTASDLPPLATASPPIHHVPVTDEAVQALADLTADATARANALDITAPGAGGLWGRSAEQVRRLTLIAALADADRPQEAVADVQHVAWANTVVWWAMRRLVQTAQDRIGDSPMERARSRVLQAVAGGPVSRRALMRGVLKGMTSREVDTVTDTLCESGVLEAVTGPRGQVCYRSAVPEDDD
jgi:hypothetical protein